MTSAPRVAQGHVFKVGNGSGNSSRESNVCIEGDVESNVQTAATYLFLTNGSRVYEIDDAVYHRLSDSMNVGDEAAVSEQIDALNLSAPAYIKSQAPEAFPIRALSLAVAQKCNLGCTYCYAQGGDFGEPSRNMPEDKAFAAVDQLIAGTPEGERANLSFLGGEPLVNRKLIGHVTRYAKEKAQEKNITIGFSITTNGTLINEKDGEFFEENGFAVTISLDGLGEVHDRQRPFKNGKGSFDRIIARVKPLLAMQRKMQVSARITVTPANVNLKETLDGFLAMGFHSVGFSPMLSAPNGREEMKSEDLQQMLRSMQECGMAFIDHQIRGERYAFHNMVSALQEIHKGTHRPYPCGAGAGYFGVGADGDLYACHRFVEDDNSLMGNVETGVDAQAQKEWLAERHVDKQSPCKGCWARYLCGGSCHYEVIHRERESCDFIRGWLDFCLRAYVILLDKVPDYFSQAPVQLQGDIQGLDQSPIKEPSHKTPQQKPQTSIAVEIKMV